jgi:hypothetical protein
MPPTLPATNAPARRSLAHRALVLLPLAFSAVVYGPVVHNFFFADDFLNLYHMQNNGAVEYLLTPNGGHLHITRNIMFLLTRTLFGTDPRIYYATEVVNHLVNVYLLYRCIELLVASPLLASFGAALWGISPMSEGSVGFYSVYGHVIAGTAVLLFLRDVFELRNEGRVPTRRTVVWWYVLALLATTSFGNGITVAMVLPFALALLLPSVVPAKPWRLPLLSLVIVIPCVDVVTIKTWEALSGLHLHSVATYRSLVTTFTGTLHFELLLVAVGWARLLLAHCPPPHTPAPLAYALLAVLVAACVWLWRRGSTTDRRLLLAFTLLILANYASIALARGVFAAKAMDAVASWGRYHYIGQIVMALLLCVLVAKLADVVGARRGGIALAAWYAFAVACYVFWAVPIDNHESARSGTEAVLLDIRQQVQAQPPGAEVFIANRPFAPLRLPGFPGWIGAFVGFFPENNVDGRQVRFVVKDPETRRFLARGYRTATLVVGPQDAKPSVR